MSHREYDTSAGCESEFNISDYISVYGKDQVEHDIKGLNDVLSRLFERGLRINFEKVSSVKKNLYSQDLHYLAKVVLQIKQRFKPFMM